MTPLPDVMIAGLILLALPIYLMPTMVAMFRSHHWASSIAVINIFLGWTLLGWVAALAMAVSAVHRVPPPTAALRPVSPFSLRQDGPSNHPAKVA